MALLWPTLGSTAWCGASPGRALVPDTGGRGMEVAQLPDSIAPPWAGDEDEEEGDTTSVFPPAPGEKAAPFDSTGAHRPAPTLLEPGAASSDTTRHGGPGVTRSLPPRPGTGAEATPPAKPERRGILGAHPAAIVLGLIAAHILIIRLITH